MNSIDEKEMQKLATIYRNSDLNYVYVCYLCESSFTNIVDTLSHMESHLDDKTNITLDKNYEFVDVSEVVSVTIDGNPIKTEYDVNELEVVSETVSDNNRTENEYASGKELELVQNFNQHYQVFTIKNFDGKCKLCNKTFDTSTLLIIHTIYDHANKLDLTCPQCSQLWENKFTFFSHLKQHVDENETTYDIMIDKLVSDWKKNVKRRRVKRPLTEYQMKSQKICDICQSSFSSIKDIYRHMSKKHTPKPTFDCDKCNRKISGSFAFHAHHYGHLTVGDAVNVLDEDVLEENLSKFLDDNIYCDDSTADKKFGCKLCSHSTVTNRKSAKLHIKQKHIHYVRKIRLKKFHCPHCQMSFAHASTLDVHKTMHEQDDRHSEKKHTPKRTFDCDKCNRKIVGRFAFHAHHYGHLSVGDAVNVLDGDVLEKNLSKFLDDNISCDDSTADKKFGCKLCSHLTVASRKSAQLHIKQRHVHYVRTNKSRKFPCPHCHMSFAHTSTLDVHRKVHEEEPQFFCVICNKSFSQLRNLRTHEITHSDIKLHQCTTCGATFRTMVRLNYHTRTHLNVTAKCSICNKELKKHRLKQHVRDVHENSHRPYSCSHCSQTFKTAKTLKNHSYRHTGEKRFECRLEHCKEVFTTSAARRAHERSKHERN